jgi:hypothetical protein
VCLGSPAIASWRAPLNRSSSTSLGLFTRSGDAWSFFPHDICTLSTGISVVFLAFAPNILCCCADYNDTGAISGSCSFKTATFAVGTQFSLRFYRNTQPIPNPSVSITVAGPADSCGVCGGNNATCAGCDGVPNSGKKSDSCGVCGGSCDDPFAISIVNPQTDYQSNLLCSGASLRLKWTSPSANRTAAGTPPPPLTPAHYLSSPQCSSCRRACLGRRIHTRGLFTPTPVLIPPAF